MPLYGYKCANGHRFDSFAKLAAYKDPQQCACGLMAERTVCAPAIRTDTIEPTRGADGKMHTSRVSYLHSLTAEGNPRGVNYEEATGSDINDSYTAPETSEAEMRESIKEAIADVANGNLPPVVTESDLPS